MKHLDGYIKDLKGNDIYYQCWLPDLDPEAILLVIHGYAEHSGRYDKLADHFVSLNYGVYALDHIGHGKSAGYRVYVHKFQDFVDTLKIYCNMIINWHPNKPIYVIGHSMGGLISTALLIDYQKKLAGAILTSPCIKTFDEFTYMKIAVLEVLSTLLPKIKIAKIKAEFISRDPKVVQAYNDDPLVNKGKITARLASELRKTMNYIIEHANKITIPILIMQGRDDKIVDPVGSQILYDIINSDDKTIKLYDHLFHEILNEPEHKRIMNNIKIWLDNQG